MVMHMHMDHSNVSRAPIEGNLQGLPDRVGPHHGSNPPVVDVIFICYRVVIDQDNRMVSIGRVRRSAGEETDSFRSE